MPAIHIYAGAARADRPQPHPCPFCGADLPPAMAACTPCAMCLPVQFRRVLIAAWDEGRGAESDRYVTALEAAVAALAKGEI